jgi:hypothetical protein
VPLRPGRLIGFDESYHVILPVSGVDGGLVGDFVEHVVQIVDGIDYFSDVGFLQPGDRGHGEAVHLPALTIPVRIAVDAVDVVRPMVRVEWPRIAVAVVVDAPALEEHDADVDPLLAGLDHS